MKSGDSDLSCGKLTGAGRPGFILYCYAVIVETILHMRCKVREIFLGIRKTCGYFMFSFLLKCSNIIIVGLLIVLLLLSTLMTITACYNSNGDYNYKHTWPRLHLSLLRELFRDIDTK